MAEVAALGADLTLAGFVFQKARAVQRLELPVLLDWPLLATSCSQNMLPVLQLLSTARA